ncbi:MAG: biotin/lipoyl-binding protein, partial [Candidatus Pacebacteria bacterium]|nr:biotin/lipoyl-binding protein [Candidatus Paceibacterota bacterium]
MKQSIKKHLFIYIILFVFATLIALSFISGQKNGESYETTQVKKTDLIQEVEVTGKVRPTQERFLAFERSGKVTSTKVEVGENVVDGQMIASLDTSEKQAQLKQAVAAIVQEENI